MANWRDGDHHNNDGGDDVNNPIVTRVELLKFRKETRDENQQFREKRQQRQYNIILRVSSSNHKEQGKFKDNIIK